MEVMTVEERRTGCYEEMTDIAIKYFMQIECFKKAENRISVFKKLLTPLELIEAEDEEEYLAIMWDHRDTIDPPMDCMRMSTEVLLLIATLKFAKALVFKMQKYEWVGTRKTDEEKYREVMATILGWMCRMTLLPPIRRYTEVYEYIAGEVAVMLQERFGLKED